MTTFLVTGASGFVGQALCAELLFRGHSVCGAVRSRMSSISSAVPVAVVGEIGADTDWTVALDGVEVVIHLAARVHVMRENAMDPLAEFRRINVAGTEHLARCAAASGVKRMVYVSSIKVNGEQTSSGQQFSETDMPAAQDPYGVSKWEAEQALRRVASETGLEDVIVRPPLVYGPGVKGNFAQMLNVVAKGIPLPFASLQNRRSLICLGNLVDALIACSTHPAAAGQTYLVSDGEDVSTTALIEKMAHALGRNSRLFYLPPVLLRILAALLGRPEQIARLLGSLRVNDEKIRGDLAWVSPFTMEQGLQATADWYLGHTSGQGKDG
ncbi:MAG: SDR family oxidoreductase [Nitrosomonadales bacterium]|nr:SDR family oxidoreductase [Nitrosomonadales bacterium]